MNKPSIIPDLSERLQTPAGLPEMRLTLIADAEALVDIGVQSEAPDIISSLETTAQEVISQTGTMPAEVLPNDDHIATVYDQLAQLRAERSAQSSVGDAYANPGPAFAAPSSQPTAENTADQAFDAPQVEAARQSLKEIFDERRAA